MPSVANRSFSDVEHIAFSVRLLLSAFYSFFVDAVELGVLRAIARAFGEEPDAEIEQSKPKMSPEEIEKTLRTLNRMWKHMRFKFL